MTRYSLTFETVTPESAESGEAAAQGVCQESDSLREILESLRSESPSRASLQFVEPSDSDPAGASWMTWGFGPDFVTGESLSLSIHWRRSVTPASRRRLVRVLSKVRV